ncbi:MAG TPA: class I SAM-dependent methyltransferase [Gemmataceae bacterium]|nr:class I SAM-dependent methyltransferase [Gemmataceae bacterium]
MIDPNLVHFLQRYDQIVGGKLNRHFPGFRFATRMRDWELYQVFSRLPQDNRSMRIMDTGAYSTYTALFLEELSEHVVISDHFGWAQRLEYTAQSVITPLDEWKTVIRTCSPKVAIQDIDLTAIPCADNTFDYITCISTMEHTANPRKALEEMIRCVKPGGRVLITTDHSPRGVPFDGNDRFFSMRQLRRLFHGCRDCSPDVPPDYAQENWCYNRPDQSILILFVEIEKPLDGSQPAAKSWWRFWA